MIDSPPPPSSRQERAGHGSVALLPRGLFLLLLSCSVNKPLPDGGADGGSADAGGQVVEFRLEDAGCWSPPELVSDAVPSVGSAAIAVDGTERVFVAWSQTADPSNRQDLLVNGYAEPSGWGRPTLLSSSAGFIDGPTMSANANGFAVTVWSSAEFGSTQQRVNLARYLPDAGGWQAPEFVDASGNTFKSLASAQVDDRGNVVVAWLEPIELNGGQLLWVRRFNAVAGAWEQAHHFEAPPFQSQASSPSLAVNGRGQVVIGFLYGANSKQVRAAVSLSDGGWREEIVGGGANVSAVDVSAAVGANGEAVVAWAQDMPGRGQRRIAAAFRRGERWEAPVQFDEDDAGAALAPSTSVDGQGNALVAWTQRDTALFAYRSATGWTAPMAFPSQEKREIASGVAVATNSSGLGAIAWRTGTATFASRTHLPFTLSEPTLINSGYNGALALDVAVSRRGTRWLLLGGRGRELGVFASHCP